MKRTIHKTTRTNTNVEETAEVLRWAPDGRAVTYVAVQNDIADIWSQPIDGGEPKRLTNFKSDEIFSFDWSRDNTLVNSHGSSARDVVLIRNDK